MPGILEKDKLLKEMQRWKASPHTPNPRIINFCEEMLIITILEYQVCLDQFPHLPSYIPGTPCHHHRTLHRLDLLLRSPAAADNGTRMAHGLAFEALVYDKILW